MHGHSRFALFTVLFVLAAGCSSPPAPDERQLDVTTEFGLVAAHLADVELSARRWTPCPVRTASDSWCDGWSHHRRYRWRS